MSRQTGGIERPGHDYQTALAVLIALLALTTFAAQFAFRAFDDNRLTSWQWVFAPSDARPLLAAQAVGVLMAYGISRLPFAGVRGSVLLFAASFAAAAPFWGSPEVIVDAARYFADAKFLELHGAGRFLKEWGAGIDAWTDLPLVPFLQGLVLSVSGESRLGIQLFTTTLFSATVVLTSLIGRALWDETVGACAGALLLAMPYLLTQPALMLVDVPTMFFLTLAVFTTIKAAGNGGVGFLTAAPVATTLAMLCKYSAWAMLTVLPIVFLVHLRHGPRDVIRRAGFVAVATAILAGAVLVIGFDVFTAQLRFLWTYQLPGLARWGESHASTFLFQVHPFVTVAALASLLVALARRDHNYVVIGWMVLLLLLLGVRRARYFLVAFPMLALLAAYALRQIPNEANRRFIVACAVVSTLVTAFLGYLPFLKGTSSINLLRAGHYLDTLEAAVVDVYTLPQARSVVNPAVAVPILDLFTAKRVVHRLAAAPPPAPAAMETSPLRFTWDVHLPSFYSPGPGVPRRAAAAVVISGLPKQPIPEHIAVRLAGYRLAREFTKTDKVFRYQVIVRVYVAR